MTKNCLHTVSILFTLSVMGLFTNSHMLLLHWGSDWSALSVSLLLIDLDSFSHPQSYIYSYSFSLHSIFYSFIYFSVGVVFVIQGCFVHLCFSYCITHQKLWNLSWSSNLFLNTWEKIPHMNFNASSVVSQYKCIFDASHLDHVLSAVNPGVTQWMGSRLSCQKRWDIMCTLMCKSKRNTRWNFI